MFYVFLLLFAALGVLARFYVGSLQSAAFFPWFTFFINFAGSVGIGISFCWLNKLSGGADQGQWLLALQIGFFGCLTTFSAFSLDVLVLGLEERYLTLAAYFVFTPTLSAVGCVGAFFITSRLISA